VCVYVCVKWACVVVCVYMGVSVNNAPVYQREWYSYRWVYSYLFVLLARGKL